MNDQTRNFDDNALDIFRLIATVQVFLGHMITHFSIEFFPSATIIYFVRGVPILFILCGFLAAKSIDKHDTKDWLIKRAIRILPSFWVCIIINTIIIAIIYIHYMHVSMVDLMIYFVTQFGLMNFYTGDWLRGYGVGAPNGALWTIGVQIQFFILVPLIHRFMKSKSLRSWIVCILSLTIVSILCGHIQPLLPEVLGKLLQVTVLPYLYFLLFGMMLWYHRESLINTLEHYNWLILIGYLLWKLAEDFLSFPHIFDGVLYNTITTILMALVIASFGFRKKVRLRKDYTYGFYLYHMVFVNIAVQIGISRNLSLLNGIMLILTIAFASTVMAWISNKFVDVPISGLYLRRCSNEG